MPFEGGSAHTASHAVTATPGTQLPLSTLGDHCACCVALGRGPKPVVPSLRSCVPTARLEKDTCCRWWLSWNKLRSLYRRIWAETHNHQRGKKGIIQKENNYSATEIWGKNSICILICGKAWAGAISALAEWILLNEITREQRRIFMTSHSIRGPTATEIYSLHCNGTLHNALHGAKKIILLERGKHFVMICLQHLVNPSALKNAM